MTVRLLLAAAAILLAASAEAEDCSRLADPLAYNACLARQGPAARAVRVGAAPAGAARQAGTRRAAAPVVSRHGRSEMVFSVRK
jgi:hypothetical protein